MSAEIPRIIEETERRIKVSARAHWVTTNRFETLSRLFTFVSITGGFIVSLLAALPIVFAKFYTAYGTEIALSIFVLGTSVSVVSTLQAIFRWSERSQDHRHAATGYTNARRQLEILRLKETLSPDDVTELLQDLSRLSDLTPSVPEAIWKAAQRDLKAGRL